MAAVRTKQEALLAGVVGVGLSLWGLWGTVTSVKLAAKGEEALGVVVSHEGRRFGDTQVEYQADGRTFETHGTVFGNRLRVSVRYLPEAPEEARVGDFLNLWGFPLVKVLAGLALAASAARRSASLPSE
jgi:hypothetical protein